MIIIIIILKYCLKTIFFPKGINITSYQIFQRKTTLLHSVVLRFHLLLFLTAAIPVIAHFVLKWKKSPPWPTKYDSLHVALTQPVLVKYSILKPPTFSSLRKKRILLLSAVRLFPYTYQSQGNCWTERLTIQGMGFECLVLKSLALNFSILFSNMCCSVFLALDRFLIF